MSWVLGHVQRAGDAYTVSIKQNNHNKGVITRKYKHKTKPKYYNKIIRVFVLILLLIQSTGSPCLSQRAYESLGKPANTANAPVHGKTILSNPKHWRLAGADFTSDWVIPNLFLIQGEHIIFYNMTRKTNLIKRSQSSVTQAREMMICL